MPRTLDSLQPGDEAVVEALQGESEATQRLMEMGLVPGTPLKIIRFAPLGDPVEILARGYHFSIRRAEAAGVVVQD